MRRLRKWRMHRSVMPSALEPNPYFDAPVTVAQPPTFYPQPTRVPKAVEISPVFPALAHAAYKAGDLVVRAARCVLVWYSMYSPAHARLLGCATSSRDTPLR